MAHLIPLSRLARLVGQPRSALQRMAQRGELTTFDGSVDLDEVLRLFPGVKLEDESELARVEQIKQEAVNKAAHPDLPEPEVLYERLKVLGKDFARSQALVRRYERLHGWIGERIQGAAERGEVPAAFAGQFFSWLRRELAATPADLDLWERLLAKERVMRVMSAQVTLLPKGQTFETVGSEMLLEAGLRAGLPMPYGCSNGTCGDCKCRVVSGEVVKVQPHDYKLTAAERAQGYTLACAYAAVGDVAIEIEGDSRDAIPEQTIATRVRAIEPLAPGLIAVHLLTPRAERLRYLAGQRLELSIAGASRIAPAASCPCDERRLEVHVRTDRGEAFDAAACALKVNDEVAVRGPFGTFVLDDASDRPLLLITSGEGFGPVKGLLQHALSLERAPQIALYRLAGARGEPLYQENLLKSYAGALETFRYVAFPAGTATEAALGQIVREVTRLADWDVYCAGEETFVAAARECLRAAGVPEERWKGKAVG